MYLPKGKTKTEETTMKKITKKAIKELAKKYGMDATDIQDQVTDMESDGILVTAELIEDMI